MLCKRPVLRLQGKLFHNTQFTLWCAHCARRDAPFGRLRLNAELGSRNSEYSDYNDKKRLSAFTEEFRVTRSEIRLALNNPILPGKTVQGPSQGKPDPRLSGVDGLLRTSEFIDSSQDRSYFPSNIAKR